jgi:hypothetical protein
VGPVPTTSTLPSGCTATALADPPLVPSSDPLLSVRKPFGPKLVSGVPSGFNRPTRSAKVTDWGPVGTDVLPAITILPSGACAAEA